MHSQANPDFSRDEITFQKEKYAPWDWQVLNSLLLTEELGPNLWLFCSLRWDCPKEVWSYHSTDGLNDQLSENFFVLNPLLHMFQSAGATHYSIHIHMIHICEYMTLYGSWCWPHYSLCLIRGFTSFLNICQDHQEILNDFKRENCCQPKSDQIRWTMETDISFNDSCF